MALSGLENFRRFTRIPSRLVTLLNITPGQTLNEVTDMPFNLIKGMWEKKYPDPIPKIMGSLRFIP
jgi:hypothetical protein